ncbi:MULTISPECIES: Hsp20 family protein [unclassified Hyphomonas]|jgi:molecular chaperone IbpA|uniref:16 kDa heat shock protein A n=2 Tax=root TaxID=1 RepID=A0A160U149_9ZZZZ|nr:MULTISPECIES: Hsp20 family protein [unclassified Hyphomonas]MAN90598.1 heat-shock protein [Hyphomonadaceae bacterium]KCZ61889.1 heat-shock protein [Hyphomonas sp. L-53-1-40]MAA82215.1 heat-shock protein [Hyphomonas sp.]MAL43824.1 heat-shock protein [Hyphomonas sp.]MAX84215.1 heat-shock protein [Hyphomonas sp.]|tara:strand:- start:2399 stop:2878 length:480 start_codon:yes stop_codon:yes gene_type:complete
MSNIDLTPLYRTVVGFDRLAGMIDQASRLDGSQGYPPYNIERVDENAFAIEIAVAGFTEDDLEIETKEGLLTVAGKRGENEDGEGRNYLHRGIAQRSFIRRYQLADHVIVTGANLQHGVLRIDLIRELPEEKKPRKIEIGAPAKSEPKLIGKKSASNAA